MILILIMLQNFLFSYFLEEKSKIFQKYKRHIITQK